jgi:hypothetical protein
MQDFSDNAEAPPRGIAGALVGIFSRRAAQDRQRLRSRLPQDRLFACTCDIGGKPPGHAIVRRGRRPKPLDCEFPFRELFIHGANLMRNEYRAQVKLSVSARSNLN